MKTLYFLYPKELFTLRKVLKGYLGYMTSVVYHPDIPAACPPPQGSPANCTVFRAVPDVPVQPQHFLSHVELGKTNVDPKKCNSWGLSVWLTEAAVAHAREVFPKLFGKQHITRVDLIPSDGTVMSTPSNTQPAHHTFWKAHNLDLTIRCKIAFGPEAAAK